MSEWLGHDNDFWKYAFSGVNSIQQPITFSSGTPILYGGGNIEIKPKYIAVIQRGTNNLVGVILYKYKDYISNFFSNNIGNKNV